MPACNGSHRLISWLLYAAYAVIKDACLCFLEPSAAPQSFTAHFNATSHDSIFLSWDPLPTEDQNGIILGYLINITDISREDTLQFSSDTHNLTIESLRPHTTYTCLVAAYTSVGMGPFSVEISVQTLETSECVCMSISEIVMI